MNYMIYMEKMKIFGENIQANKLQDSISSVQKAIGLIGDMFIKDKGTDTNTYTPRPIYRKFDD